MILKLLGSRTVLVLQRRLMLWLELCWYAMVMAHLVYTSAIRDYILVQGTPYTAVLPRSRLRRGPWPVKARPNSARQQALLTNALHLCYRPSKTMVPLLVVIGELRDFAPECGGGRLWKIGRD